MELVWQLFCALTSSVVGAWFTVYLSARVLKTQTGAKPTSRNADSEPAEIASDQGPSHTAIHPRTRGGNKTWTSSLGRGTVILYGCTAIAAGLIAGRLGFSSGALCDNIYNSSLNEYELAGFVVMVCLALINVLPAVSLESMRLWCWSTCALLTASMLFSIGNVVGAIRYQRFSAEHWIIWEGMGMVVGSTIFGWRQLSRVSRLAQPNPPPSPPAR